MANNQIMYGEYFTSTVCALLGQNRSWECTMHDLAHEGVFPDRNILFRTWSTTDTIRLSRGIVHEINDKCCTACKGCGEAKRCNCAHKWLHGFKYITVPRQYTAQPQWFEGQVLSHR